MALKKYDHSDLRSAVVVDKIVPGIDREPTDRIDEILGIIKKHAQTRLAETETMAKDKLEACQWLSFLLISLILAGVGFGIFSAYSIINDLPAGESRKIPESRKL